MPSEPALPRLPFGGAESKAPASGRVAAALARNAALWRDRSFAPRRHTIAAIAAASGMTPALLDESLDALLAPVTRAALDALAMALPRASWRFGFIMPGNVPGAGIHEICAALLAGACIIIKPASAEPRFFQNFLRTLNGLDPHVASRAAIVNFRRDDGAAMRELWERSDGGVVAYGDDATVAALDVSRAGRHFIGYASRSSAALVTAEALAAPAAADAVAAQLARDVTLFEQRGCLSPHHIFVAGGVPGEARGFAARLARALETLARRLPPARQPLATSAAIRALRERARWRSLAQRADTGIALLEGERLGWTVVYDRDSAFCPSPGYRTVVVSTLDDGGGLGPRLGAAARRLEACALAATAAERARLERLLHDLGATYVCEPGMMQSPPLDWPHGGGAFVDLLRSSRR